MQENTTAIPNLCSHEAVAMRCACPVVEIMDIQRLKEENKRLRKENEELKAKCKGLFSELV